jgi:hypothetical protein
MNQLPAHKSETMKKTGIIAVSAVVVLLVIGGLIYSRLGYKTCWNCNADGYFTKAMENACSDRADHRQAALDFIGKAADQGLARAEFFLAELYSESLPQGYVALDADRVDCMRQDVAADSGKAVSFFTAAAKTLARNEKSDPAMAAELGLLYLAGVLQAEDPVAEAIAWYEKAAEAGDHGAMRVLARLENDRGEYVRAAQWLTRAAEDTSDAASLLMLGDYAQYGKGRPVDLQEAEKMYARGLERARSGKDEGLQNTLAARLDLVRRRIADSGGSGPPQVLKYHLDGGVHHVVVFVDEQPQASVGEVINRDGSISAVIKANEEIGVQDQAREGFSSMNEGVFWILETYGRAARGDAGTVLRFELTKP